MSRRDLKTIELNAHHNEMVLKYLRFAILHRKRQVKDMEGIFEEYKDTRLGSGESFTSDEVSTLLDSLGATLKADMYRNLQIISNSNGILLKQLFAQAEDNIVNLTVDTSILEDEFLLSMVQKLEDDAETQPARSTSLLEASSISSSMLPAKLPTLHDEKKAEELLISNAAMKKRQLELEEEVSKLKQELQNKESNLKSQIAVLSERLQQSEAALAAAAPAAKEEHDVASSGDLAGLHRRIRELELEVSMRSKEVQELEAQLVRRVNEAPQFKQLNDLLKQKNGKLKFYRDKLVGMGWTEDDGEDDD